MAAGPTFDPYHKWLGIPPTDRPLTFYRLLGLERYEADPAVIEAAIQRQSRFLADMAADEHLDAARKVLKQVRAAKACLLDTAQKAEYDRRLRQQLATSGSPKKSKSAASLPVAKRHDEPARRASSTSSPVLLDSLADLTAESDAPALGGGKSLAAQTSVRRKKQTLAIQAAASAVVLVLVAVGAGYLLNPSNSSPSASVAPTPPLVDAEPATRRAVAPSPHFERMSAHAAAVDIPDAPVTSRAALSSDVELWLTHAQRALKDRRLNDAAELLHDYVEQPGAEQKGKARILLEEIALVQSHRGMVELLLAAPDEHWEAVATTSVFSLPAELFPHFTNTTLRDLYQQGLQEHVMKAYPLYIQRKSGSDISAALAAFEPAPAAPRENAPEQYREPKEAEDEFAATPPADAAPQETPADEGEDASVAAQEAVMETPEEMGDPAEFLASRGLVNHGASWLLASEEDFALQEPLINEARKAVANALKKVDSKLIRQRNAAREEVEALTAEVQRHEEVIRYRAVDMNVLNTIMSLKRRRDTAEKTALSIDAALAESEAVVIAARADYEAALTGALTVFEGVEDHYRGLQRDAQVREALNTLQQRLGPSNSFRSSGARYAKLKKELQQDGDAVQAGGF